MNCYWIQTRENGIRPVWVYRLREKQGNMGNGVLKITELCILVATRHHTGPASSGQGCEQSHHTRCLSKLSSLLSPHFTTYQLIHVAC